MNEELIEIWNFFIQKKESNENMRTERCFDRVS